MCGFPRRAVVLVTVAIYVVFLCIYFKSDAKTAGSQNRVQTYYERQKSARLQYLNKLRGREWSTLYIVLVPEVICPYSVRVGSVTDGGKYVCNPERMPRKQCSIYSLGIGNDISFDEEIQAFNNYSCRIYGYNKRVIQKDLRARYKEINGEFAALQIAPVTQKHKNNYALNDLVKFNKDETVEFLKMDIEQSEHDTLMPFLEEYRVCQLFVEIHGEAQKHTSLLQRIASLDYALFSFEPNPYCKYCCEYSFIHLDCMQRYGASVSKLYLKDIVPALN